jgi:hypothetical protein
VGTHPQYPFCSSQKPDVQGLGLLLCSQEPKLPYVWYLSAGLPSPALGWVRPWGISVPPTLASRSSCTYPMWWGSASSAQPSQPTMVPLYPGNSA